MSPCDKDEKDITVIFMDQGQGSDRNGEIATWMMTEKQMIQQKFKKNLNN